MTKQELFGVLVAAVFAVQLAGCERSKETKSPNKGGVKQSVQSAQQKKAAVSAQARSALAGLKKLDFRTNVGINYRDYSAAVTDAVYPVSEYLKTPEGAKDTPFNQVLRNSSRFYVLAAEVWNPTSECVSPLLLARVREELKIADVDFECIAPTSVVRVLWRHAADELQKLEDQ